MIEYRYISDTPNIVKKCELLVGNYYCRSSLFLKLGDAQNFAKIKDPVAMAS